MSPEKKPSRPFSIGFKKPGQWMRQRTRIRVSQRILEIKRITNPLERNRVAFDLWASLPKESEKSLVALIFNLTKKQ